jgi:hypothetical protein
VPDAHCTGSRVGTGDVPGTVKNKRTLPGTENWLPNTLTKSHPNESVTFISNLFQFEFLPGVFLIVPVSWDMT